VPISIRIHTDFVFTFLWYSIDGNGNEESMNYCDGSERSSKISMAVREEVKFPMASRKLAHYYMLHFIFLLRYIGIEEKINRKTSGIIPTPQVRNKTIEKRPPHASTVVGRVHLDPAVGDTATSRWNLGAPATGTGLPRLRKRRACMCSLSVWS